METKHNFHNTWKINTGQPNENLSSGLVWYEKNGIADGNHC